jgi:hypothetical protein
VLDETTLTRSEIDHALARTHSRHVELVAGKHRRRGLMAGVGFVAVIVVGVLLPILSGNSGDQPVRVKTPALAASPPPSSPDVAVGGAATTRRSATIRSTSTSPDGAALAIVFECETASDRVVDMSGSVHGTVLVVRPVIESTDPSAPCSGSSRASTTIAVPPELRGVPFTVEVGLP